MAAWIKVNIAVVPASQSKRQYRAASRNGAPELSQGIPRLPGRFGIEHLFVRYAVQPAEGSQKPRAYILYPRCMNILVLLYWRFRGGRLSRNWHD
jgi:hypothetical protein